MIATSYRAQPQDTHHWLLLAHLENKTKKESYGTEWAEHHRSSSFSASDQKKPMHHSWAQAFALLGCGLVDSYEDIDEQILGFPDQDALPFSLSGFDSPRSFQELQYSISHHIPYML